MARVPSADGLPTIEGYAAKAGRSIMGNEGPAYWSTIFHNGKVIGKAHEAGEGGPVSLYFDDREEERVYNETAKRLSTEFDFEQDSGFLGMLLAFADRTKTIRKWSAKGYVIFVEAYKESCFIGDHFILGQGDLMAYMKGYDDGLLVALKKKGYDTARRVNADGTYGEWLFKLEPEAKAETPEV